MQRFLILIALGLASQTIAFAELSVPNFFSDHMVLQRERAAPLWGKASPGAEVRLELSGQSATAKADAYGRWRAEMQTGPANAKGATLTISSGDETIQIEDVLIGEVWFASGQSNMAYAMKSSPVYNDLVAKSDHPGIRMFNAVSATATEPQDNINGKWTVCSPSSVPAYSAVAFFFARKLHQELGVPIGVIKSAWGGKPVETFTSRKALRTLPGTNALVDALIKADKRYDGEKAKVAFLARRDQWETAMAERRKKPANKRGRAPRKPAAPKRPLATEGKPGVLFDAMINPFAGYAMRGAIWYQGEANAKPGHVPYDKTLPLLINDWRQRWNDDFSFYFVQLANFRAPSTEPGTQDSWALLQDRMRLILDTTPKTGMAVINDVGAANNIHPKNKKDPGERLALWALAKDYGRDIVYCGPLYQSSKIDGNAIRVTFDQAGAGLASKDGEPLQRFEIAGKNRQWHWAKATLDGKDSVLVRSPDVAAPLAVRYAWAANPEGANLVNSEGLPTSVFRTDHWKDVETQPQKLQQAR